jgi:hypothetical protein
MCRMKIGVSLLLLVLCAGGARAGSKEAVVPIPFHDGVLDADTRTAFVSSPKGGIQAIQLSDGKILWTNDSALAQPWLVAGPRLIARGERVLVIDVATGKLLRQCDALDLPKPKVPERCTVSFPLWNPRANGDTLQANWYAVAHIDRSKGRPFPFQEWTAFNKAVPTGTVSINLQTGKTTDQTEAKTTDVTAGLIPVAARPDREPAGLPKSLVPLWQQYHKDQNGRVTIMGGRLVGVAMILEKRGQEYDKRIVLNAWDLKTGMAAEPVELIKDKALSIANIVLTEDRRHTAVMFGNSALNFYSLSNGKPIAAGVKGISAPDKAYVNGSRLYFTQRARGAGVAEVTLTALDLDSGKFAWERSLKPQTTNVLPP